MESRRLRRSAKGVPLPFRTFSEILAHGLVVEVWCFRCKSLRAGLISRGGTSNPSPEPVSAAKRSSAMVRCVWRLRPSFDPAAGRPDPTRQRHRALRSLLRAMCATVGDPRRALRSAAVVGRAPKAHPVRLESAGRDVPCEHGVRNNAFPVGWNRTRFHPTGTRSSVTGFGKSIPLRAVAFAEMLWPPPILTKCLPKIRFEVDGSKERGKLVM